MCGFMSGSFIPLINLSGFSAKAMWFLLVQLCTTTWNQGWCYLQKLFYCIGFFAYPGIFVSLYEAEYYSFKVCKELQWNLKGTVLNLCLASDKMVSFTMFVLPILSLNI